MQTITRVTKVEVELQCVQLALAAFQHPHCFGRSAIIQWAYLANPLDDAHLEDAHLEAIMQGKKRALLYGSVLENLQQIHRFQLECWLRPLESGGEMPVDLRLDDGHTVVCGHAVLVQTEDGGIKFEVKT